LEVLLTFRAIMLRIRDDEITRTPQVEIPQVVQRPLELLVPIGLVTTPRTGLARIGATGRDELWRWQVGNCGHAFGGIGSIRPRTEHGCVLRDHMLGPELYDRCPSEAIPKPGKDAIVSMKVLFVAGFGPVMPDMAAGRAFYADVLGLPLKG